jgi:uncharacterized protein (TIGR03437 family)
MLRNSLIVGALVACTAWGQAPAYSAADIVNSSNYAPGPFAANSVLSIFGSNLSWDAPRALVSDDIVTNTLPTALAGVQVYVDNWPAPLLYVSATQINFIVPGNEISGDSKVRVVREGVTGPEVTMTLVDSAPALFSPIAGYALASHADSSLISAASPAHPGEIVVLYATGLGKTQPNPSPGVIPQTAALMEWLNNLTVYLDGAALASFRIKYAGATPFSVGLYQINIELPNDVGPDPEIRVAVAAQSSPAGLRIPVQQANLPQLFRPGARSYR